MHTAFSSSCAPDTDDHCLIIFVESSLILFVDNLEVQYTQLTFPMSMVTLNCTRATKYGGAVFLYVFH